MNSPIHYLIPVSLSIGWYWTTQNLQTTWKNQSNNCYKSMQMKQCTNTYKHSQQLLIWWLFSMIWMSNSYLQQEPNWRKMEISLGAPSLTNPITWNHTVSSLYLNSNVVISNAESDYCCLLTHCFGWYFLFIMN